MGRIWLLLIGYFLLNWLVLYVHYNFMSPMFYGFVKFVPASVLINRSILLVNLQFQKLLEPWLAGSPRRIMVFKFVVQPRSWKNSNRSWCTGSFWPGWRLMSCFYFFWIGTAVRLLVDEQG